MLTVRSGEAGLTLFRRERVPLVIVADDLAMMPCADVVRALDIQGVHRKTDGPAQLVLWVSDGMFAGVIYAPQSVVTLTGSGQFLGSFVGQQMKLTGSARVHYDTALRGE